MIGKSFSLIKAFRFRFLFSSTAVICIYGKSKASANKDLGWIVRFIVGTAVSSSAAVERVTAGWRWTGGQDKRISEFNS